jgi:YVTN family beta-propeller protein
VLDGRRRRAIAITTMAVLLSSCGAAVGAASSSSPTPTHASASPATPAPTATGSNHPNADQSPTPKKSGNVWAAITSGRLSPVVRHDHPYVYVPNGTPGTLEVIDPTTFKVVRRYSFGAGAMPEHVTPAWDLRHLYVDVDARDELAVIDPRTGKITHTIHGIDHPYNLYFTPDGSQAIVVAEYENRLVFMDPNTWHKRAELALPCRGPDHMDFGPPGSHYLVISCEYDGAVIKVDWQTHKVLRTTNIGGLPVDVKLAPNGRVFFVANQGTGGVYVLDAQTLHRLAFIPTGAGAHGFAVSRDATELYVSNRLAGSISVIDFATRKVVKTWNVGGSPDMLQVSPDGSQLWLSNRYGTTVSVIGTHNGNVLHHIEVGPDPHGLTYFPQPGNYSLGHNGVYR